MIEERLTEIADHLDDLNEERDDLFAERLALWRQGQRQGLKPVALARASRIKAVTLRTLLARAKENA